MNKKKYITPLLAKIFALLERSSITFKGQPYPKFGWAIFTAGGPGSGKSYAIKNQFLIDAKILDSDTIKMSYIKLLNRIIDSDILSKKDKDKLLERFGGRVPNPKNPIDMDNVHKYISWEKHYFSKVYKNFLRNSGKRLSNVIIDSTGNNLDEIVTNVKILKELGYKTSMVWVVVNIDLAILRNSNRGRTVPHDYLNMVHDKLIKSIPDVIRVGLLNELDELWILFSTNSNEKLYKEKFKNSVFKLDKINGKFDISDGLLKNILDFSGLKKDGNDGQVNR